MTTPITREQLNSAIDTGSVTVVDALPAAPYGQRHIPGALNLVEGDAEAKATELLPDLGASIVTYSTNAVCGRGEALARRLEELGYTDVRVYREGIEDWVGAGLPVNSGVPAERADTANDHVIRGIHPLDGPRNARFEGEPYGAGISFFLVDNEPGQGPKLHQHPYPETWIVLSGHGVFEADGNEVAAGPGDTVVVGPNTPHRFRNTGPERLELVCIHAAERMVTEWL